MASATSSFAMASELDEQRLLWRNLHKHAATARQRQALSVVALAHLSGARANTVRAVEAGDKTDATIWELQRLAVTLGLTPKGLPRAKDVFEDDDVC